MSPEPDPRLVEALAALVKPGDRLFVLGLCGAQGSGKSTVTRALAAHLWGRGLATAILSLDDLYLTHAERARMGREVHPLFATRGVPGTHDVDLGMRLIDALSRGEAAPLPRFDKASDDRLPAENWPLAPEHSRVLILEGWCVGAAPQPEGALDQPINELERCEDSEAVWRRHANACLAGQYRALFGRIDALALLAAPDFGVVAGWRQQQERDIAGQGARVMDPAAILHFIQFYQRITEWILAEMPARADLVARLDADRRVVSID